MNHRTPQEAFWAGEFGDAYVDRNQGPRWTEWNITYFQRLLAKAKHPASLLELGCNRGLNLHALMRVYPEAELSAVELNSKAVEIVRRDLPQVKLHHGSILDFKPERTWDVVFTNGVLIHLAPEALAGVYALMAKASARYVLISEYYNPTPVEVTYRGHAGKLFKRDFAGEFLDAHKDFQLIDYGFVYHRDPLMPPDDMTWFLMERQGGAA